MSFPGAEPVPGKGCWTPQRYELRDWLRRNAPSLAELYEGAVQLLFEMPIPGYTRFVAHSVREIRNRLADALSGTTTGGRLDYKTRLDEIDAEWKRVGFLDTTSASNSSPIETVDGEINLPHKLRILISNLIADHIAAREKPIETATRLFFGLVSDNQRLVDAIRPTLLEWLKVTNWFMGKTHDSGATDVNIDLPELQGRFELFETYLLAIVRARTTFFVITDELDDILEDTNQYTD
jgi:hypothetical protein